MASLEDIGLSAFINILSAIGFLLVFAVLRVQPFNDRVYYPKWYISGGRSSPRGTFDGAMRFVNLNIFSYVGSFLSWVLQALMMSQTEIIQHAGLDSAIYLRIYILGLKIFVPLTIIALLVIIPINVSGGTLLDLQKEIVFSNIDKLSISNVRPGSERFLVHLLMAYLFTIWTCYILYKEYDNVASMRLHFLASQHRRAEQFTHFDWCNAVMCHMDSPKAYIWCLKSVVIGERILSPSTKNQTPIKVVVRNIPPSSKHLTSETVDQFFKKNHPDHYLDHQVVYNANKFVKLVKKKERLQNWLDYNQLKFDRNPEKRPTKKTGFLGLCSKRVDSIDYFKQKISKLEQKMNYEREKIFKDSKSVLPVSFVTFDSRWGAAVCAQTQQSKDPTQWLTDWAPEPCDIYWKNLSIPFVSLSIRRLIMSVSLFALVFFYMIPITFVQSLANLEGLEKVVPFLRPVIESKLIKSFLQGFLPGLALKIFLHFLPTVLLLMSKAEGYLSLSALERRAAAKYYYFMLVNVFLGSIVAGTAFEQLYTFLHEPPTQIPRTIGVSIPMKATFFMTYVMVDGWAGVAGETLRLKQLVIYQLKNIFIVKTDRDRQKAMYPESIGLIKKLPTLQLYFLLGLVYAVVTPILLPFILIFFILSFLVYRHQIINVYNQKYESAGAFWPHVHSRIIASLLISHLLLLGLLSTKKAAYSTPLLIALPVLTIWFHKYCKSRFESAFRKYALEEAMEKDMAEKASEPGLNLRAYFTESYLHPMLKTVEDEEMRGIRVDKVHTQSSSPTRVNMDPPLPHDQ